MPRFSKSQIDKLGEQLRKQDVPEEQALKQLQLVRAEYSAPLTKVESVLRNELGLQPTSRIKTVNTIIEKLKRDKTRLSRMQDLAGLRVTQTMALLEQDEIVARICRFFPESHILDRRTAPNHGYRAVHIVVRVDDLPVEVQIRTKAQHLWAQLFEKLADRVGRAIRYGGTPESPEAQISGIPASQWVRNLMTLSEIIAYVEEFRAGEGEREQGLFRLLEQLAPFYPAEHLKSATLTFAEVEVRHDDFERKAVSLLEDLLEIFSAGL